jgi:ATP-binding cassette, subfamily B, bacterial PglK
MFASVRLSLSFLTGKQRIQYFALVILKALTGLFDIVGIALIGVIAGVAVTQLNSTSSGAGTTKILGFTIPRIDGQALVWLVIFVLLVFVLKAVIAISLTWRLTAFVAAVESENARRIANYLLRGSLASVKKYSTSEFQYAITGSTTYAFTGLLNNLATFVSEGFLLLVVSATFFFVNPIAAIFALAYFSVVILIIQVFIGGQLKRAGKGAVEGTLLALSTISDTLDSFREVSVLAKQDLFIDRIYSARRQVARSNAVMTFLSGMPRYVVETALMLGVVIFVGQQFLTGQLSTGIVTIGVFLTGGVRIMASLLPLQSAIGAMKPNVEQAALAQSFLTEIVANQTVVADSPGPLSEEHTAVGGGGLPIHIEKASYRYPGNSVGTLHDISLEVPGGQQVAIIGPSGAGKTTLVDMILGLIHPDSGQVRIGGIEPNVLRKLAPGAVSYVPQKPGIVSGSIAENVALGILEEDIDYELLDDVLKAAFLEDFIATLPEGVHASVGMQSDALSGGQIQRIGLARALYARPRLLILDEATSGLDASSESFISRSLHSLHGSVTVVIIAHRLSTVQHSDMVHVVEDGQITASDKFKALQTTVPLVAEYVRLMSFNDE